MTKKFRIWGLVQDRLSPANVVHTQLKTGLRLVLAPYYLSKLLIQPQPFREFVFVN